MAFFSLRNLTIAFIMGVVLTVIAMLTGISDQGFAELAMPEGAITLPLYSGTISGGVFSFAALVAGWVLNRLTKRSALRSTNPQIAHIISRVLLGVLLGATLFLLFKTPSNTEQLIVLASVGTLASVLVKPKIRKPKGLPPSEPKQADNAETIQKRTA